MDTAMGYPFSDVPDAILLIVLQHCTYGIIQSSRIYQSCWVQHCTEYITIKGAVEGDNLDNLEWIKDRMKESFIPNQVKDWNLRMSMSSSTFISILMTNPFNNIV